MLRNCHRFSYGIFHCHHNQANTSIRFGIIQKYPYVSACAFENTCANRGYSFETAMYVCENLRANCTFVRYPSIDYGDYDPDSRNLSGLIGAVYRGEFDTSDVSLTPTYNRLQAVGFSESFFYTDLILITKSVFAEPPLNWMIVNAFQWPVWTTIITALILACAVIIFIQFRLRSPVILLGKFVEASLSMITRQYARVQKRPSATVLVVSLWALSFVVLSNAYTGVLVSKKLTQSVNPPFNNLTTFVDCLYDGRCRLVVTSLNSSATQVLLNPRTYTGDRAKRAVQKYGALVMAREKIIEKILNEPKLYLVWLTSTNSFSAAVAELRYPPEKCHFYTVPTSDNDNGGFAVRKNSTLLPILNKLGTRFRESGLSDAIVRKYLTSYEICAGQGFKNGFTLKLTEISSFLTFYAVGIAAGFSSLFIEFMHAKHRNLYLA